MFTSVNGKWFTDPLGAFMGQWPFEMWMAVDVVLYTIGVWLAAYVVSAASKTWGGEVIKPENRSALSGLSAGYVLSGKLSAVSWFYSY